MIEFTDWLWIVIFKNKLVSGYDKVINYAEMKNATPKVLKMKKSSYFCNIFAHKYDYL